MDWLPVCPLSTASVGMLSFTLLLQKFFAQTLIFAPPLVVVTLWGNRGAERLWQVVNPLGSYRGVKGSPAIINDALQT